MGRDAREVGRLLPARDRLPRQLRVARDKGHVRVALLFSRLEDEHRAAREGLEGAEELARCAPGRC